MNMEFWKASLIRAFKTFLQTILGVWTAGQVITEIDWKVTLLAALSAAVYSLLTSILAGLPEVEQSKPVEMTEKEAKEAIANGYEGEEEFEEGDDE